METIHEIPNSEHIEQQDPLFLGFPSPFFDDISTTIIPENNQSIHLYPINPANITERSHEPSVSKDLKKRSGGKKDRHSKIHTAQGVRDRRMRLSIHIARKFFHLQDLLGFDKASKTIEWLFCKSSKAIKEVTEKFNPQRNPQHVDYQSVREVDCEGGLTKRSIASAKKVKKSKEEEMIKKRESRKQNQNRSLVKETRDQARARARDRTRERLMIKELERSRQFFGANPKDELLGFISSPCEPLQQESSSSSFEHSSTHHLVPQPLPVTNSFENYPLSVVDTSNLWSTLVNHNPQEVWLDSCNGFLPGEWDADSFVTEYSNYGTTASLTGDGYEQNPNNTNILHFQYPNQWK